ncbi:MAG: hypothetical protein K2X27_08610 [Candidatus Obscuribacterales bacterium]|nr:hypothetical protein [Candidatus Obscuribacterales bacterium]
MSMTLSWRFLLGLAFCLALALSAYLFRLDYLNPWTVSLHIAAYFYLCFLACTLHRRLAKLNAQGYPIGAFEVSILMLVPFFYIFWNAHWFEELCHRAKVLPFGGSFYLTGPRIQSLLFAALSVLCFPDNLGRLPGIISIFAFALIFYMLDRIHLQIGAQATKS